MKKIRIAVLGAGGLGKAAARIIGMKNEAVLVGMCDTCGYLFDENGLDCEKIYNLQGSDKISDLKGGVKTDKGIDAIIDRANSIDGIFMALPNLPNEFMPAIAKKFAERSKGLVFADALKRTTAVNLMFNLDKDFKNSENVYITGCGATPGILSAAAVVAAQSFVKVEEVKIWWGVGISNWDAYRATIREDIAHLPGFNVERANALTDSQVTALLDKTDGKLELHKMEHADDVLLQRVGVVSSASMVEVGGVMDTRSSKKPVSTTMTLTGVTFEGKRSTHKFILGDETSMAANVVGPALGYIKRALWLKSHKIYGMFGSTEFMPMVMN